MYKTLKPDERKSNVVVAFVVASAQCDQMLEKERCPKLFPKVA